MQDFSIIKLVDEVAIGLITPNQIGPIIEKIGNSSWTLEMKELLEGIPDLQSTVLGYLDLFNLSINIHGL